MNTGLTDELYSHLEGAPLRQIAQQLGIGQAQMATAASMALPMLLGAMGNNSQQQPGAQALFGALSQDHRGLDLGSVIGSVLGGTRAGQAPASKDGAKILGHVFGQRQPRVEQTLGTATGLGAEKSNTLLRLLAPVVMAYLAKRMFDQRQPREVSSTQADPSPQVLGQVLGQEQQRVRQQGGIAGGLLGAVLDQDGDGQLGLGDLIKAGSGLLGANR